MSDACFNKSIEFFQRIGGGELMLSPVVGEVLTDPLFLSRLEIASSADLVRSIFFHTNLIALDQYTDDELDFILETTSSLSVSLGPNQEEYAFLFGVDRYEQVLKNLHRLLEHNARIVNPAIVYIGGRARTAAPTVDPRLKQIVESGDVIAKWRHQYCNWSGEVQLEAFGLEKKKVQHDQRPCIHPYYSVSIFCDGQIGLCITCDYNAEMIVAHVDDNDAVEKVKLHRHRYLESYRDSEWKEKCLQCTFYLPCSEERVARWLQRDLDREFNAGQTDAL